MKNKILLTFAFLCSSMVMMTTANAGSGDMGGGRSLKVNVLSFPNSSIEAVISKDGIYARLIDLQEGFEHFNGLKVTPKETIINLNGPSGLNVDSIILNDGNFIHSDMLKAVSGGDMGGG